ncbi:hypothetical protein Pmani_005344 [Petrolisthes manimaculis]|uniref:Uncharacterized protein n=1 Tax=Petrolisthes manimaculis TaxID=1843537 RepID=A0AAE1QF58_9EUCA|nr:hypothetical protein Pmani_005344 [Petrolisthes manimaculis]
MEYSGPAAIAEVEHDPHLSDNEEQAIEHWPPLKPSAQHEFQSVAASTSTKRPKDYGSDTSSEPQSPAVKLTKCNELPTRQETDVTLPRKLPLPVPLIFSSAAPAFAPRDDYIKLAFRENLTSRLMGEARPDSPPKRDVKCTTDSDSVSCLSRQKSEDQHR